MHRGENHLNQNRGSRTKARHDLPHLACTFVCDTSGQSYDNNATEAMKALRRWQWAVLRVSLSKMSRNGRVNRSNQSPSLPPMTNDRKVNHRVFSSRRSISLSTFTSWQPSVSTVIWRNIDFGVVALRTAARCNTVIRFFLQNDCQHFEQSADLQLRGDCLGLWFTARAAGGPGNCQYIRRCPSPPALAGLRACAKAHARWHQGQPPRQTPVTHGLPAWRGPDC